MDTYDIKRLALVLAVQAEIEAMKAENQESKTIVFGHRHFSEKAEELKNLAYVHNDQL